jgi:hypothetical protein
VTIDPVALTVQAEAALARIKADPIAAFRFSSEAQRLFVRALSLFRETVLRAGNQSGKSTVGAYAFVAIARGCTELDGEPLPMLGVPNNGLVLAKGREQAKESIIRCYKQAIGDWPHHFEKQGTAITAVWVKPNRSKSDDWQDWSCIRFFVEDGQDLSGMRLDWCHGDEPPKEAAWEELRMRGKANKRFVRAITFTPIDKREWLWLRNTLKGCAWPKGRNGTVEITLSVYDNKALSPEHIANLEVDAKKSGKLAEAKLMGEYVDMTGSNPFDADGLKRWMGRAREGEKVEFYAVGLKHYWERWAEYDPEEDYFVVADPSQGIEDIKNEHDPCEVVVVARRRPRLVARYNGYLPAYELGRLAASLGHQYGYAMVVWERNSGYGESFYHGLGNYGNVYVEDHHDALHLTLSQRIGWTTTATTRGTIIGALQKAILEDSILVESAECVESLSNVIINRLNRIEAGPGAHDEDMIVLGLACHLMEANPCYARPSLNTTQTMEKLGMIQKQPKRDLTQEIAEW